MSTHPRPSRYFNDNGNKSFSLKEKLNSFDACVILTDHSNIDYQSLKNHSKIIIDTRNVFNRDEENHIIRLGQG